MKDARAPSIDPLSPAHRLVRLLARATAVAMALPGAVLAQSLTFTGTVDDVQLAYGNPAVTTGDSMRAWLSFVDDPVLVDLVDYDGLGNPGQSGQLAVYGRNGIAALTLGSTNLRAHVSHVNIFNDYTDATHPDPIDAWNYVVEIGTACDPGVVERASFSLIDWTGTALSDTGFVEADAVDGLDASFTFAGGVLDPVTYECQVQDPLGAADTGVSGPIDAVGVFFDVTTDHWAFPFIRTLAADRITLGCGAGNFCPTALVQRVQMAIFLERGMRGSDFVPPPAQGNVFLDLWRYLPGADYVEQLYLDGITVGCGGQYFCPFAYVTRAQMAVFLLRAMHGAAYTPPPPSGVFADVDVAYWAAAWIEQLAAEGITSGCGGVNFCPEARVTRAQMALFLVRTFGL